MAAEIHPLFEVELKKRGDSYTNQLEHLAESCTFKEISHKDTKTFVKPVYKHIPRGSAKFYGPLWNRRLDELQTEQNKRRKTAEAKTSRITEGLKQAQNDLE
jgi:hypothetical protein